MKYLIAAAAMAAFTVPAFAGEDVPGRNNPHLPAAMDAASSASPTDSAKRVAPMAGDVPGRRTPHRAMPDTGAASVAGTTHPGETRGDLGWNNDDYPGDRQPS